MLEEIVDGGMNNPIDYKNVNDIDKIVHPADISKLAKFHTCYHVLIAAFAKFSGAPVKSDKTNNPWKSDTGTLPVFRNGSEVIHYTFKEISSYLRSQNYNADYLLSARQCSEVSAYAALLKEELYPSLLYTWWLDSKNYVEFTRPWYARALPFPHNFYIPGKMRNSSEAVVKSTFKVEFSEESDLQFLVYEHAKRCFSILSCKLANKEYFFGSSPTSIDAIIFSYLAPLLKAPFPNSTLQDYLKEFENLKLFVNRILDNYFPRREGLNSETNIQKESVGDYEFPNKRRNKILFVGFGIVCTIAFAFLQGILQVSFLNDDEDEYSQNSNSYKHLFESQDDDMNEEEEDDTK
ncbi:Metaxin-1 [Nymphon striatum]|nr:Metaxin-1 [Nymphon striatum]